MLRFRATEADGVMLPDSLTTIHASAFADCANLTAIQLPEGLLRLEGEAFSGCLNSSSALPMSLNHRR